MDGINGDGCKFYLVSILSLDITKEAMGNIFADYHDRLNRRGRRGLRLKRKRSRKLAKLALEIQQDEIGYQEPPGSN